MIWLVLGCIGQGLFFLRFWIQWRASERARSSVVPGSFWWMSLFGSVLLAVYTLAVKEPVLVGGYAASAWIYARNAALGQARGSSSRLSIALQATVIVAILSLAFFMGARDVGSGETSPLWFGIAVTGQLCWSARFVVQWLASELSGVSHFPRSFWWTSLVGNLMLLAYAAHRADPLLVAAFAFGPLVQIRNLMLSRRPRSVAAPLPGAADGLAEPQAR